MDNNYDNYAKRIHLSQYKALENNGYIFVYFSKKSDTDLKNICEDSPISNYDLSDNVPPKKEAPLCGQIFLMHLTFLFSSL